MLFKKWNATFSFQYHEGTEEGSTLYFELTLKQLKIIEEEQNYSSRQFAKLENDYS